MKIDNNTVVALAYKIHTDSPDGMLIEFADELSPRSLIFGFDRTIPGFEKKLIAGIVLTGGGSQLKHIDQLTEFTTGMDTRIGYPSEHLASTVPDEMASPMFATGVGLVIHGILRSEVGRLFQPDTDEKKAKKSGGFWGKKKDNDEGGSNRFLRKISEFFQDDTEA